MKTQNFVIFIMPKNTLFETGRVQVDQKLLSILEENQSQDWLIK